MKKLQEQEIEINNVGGGGVEGGLLRSKRIE